MESERLIFLFFSHGKTTTFKGVRYFTPLHDLQSYMISVAVYYILFMPAVLRNVFACSYLDEHCPYYNIFVALKCYTILVMLFKACIDNLHLKIDCFIWSRKPHFDLQVGAELHRNFQKYCRRLCTLVPTESPVLQSYMCTDYNRCALIYVSDRTTLI